MNKLGNLRLVALSLALTSSLAVDVSIAADKSAGLSPLGWCKYNAPLRRFQRLKHATEVPVESTDSCKNGTVPGDVTPGEHALKCLEVSGHWEGDCLTLACDNNGKNEIAEKYKFACVPTASGQ